MKLTAHRRLVLRLRMSAALLALSDMALWWQKSQNYKIVVWISSSAAVHLVEILYFLSKTEYWNCILCSQFQSWVLYMLRRAILVNITSGIKCVYRLTHCLTSWVLLSARFCNAARLCKYFCSACSKCC